jgi:cysteine desulfurase
MSDGIRLLELEERALNRFYFDHNATTPVSEEVLAAHSAALRDAFGNPSSVHRDGQIARQRLEQARAQVAALVGCTPKEIVVTSGGTEADNLAILGAVRALGKPHAHIITTAIEHPAVLNACAQLEREGVAVTYIQPDGEGVVNPDEIRRQIRPETVLISTMHANNETGAIQPVEAIGAIARAAGVLFHVDGVQAAGRLPVDVRALGADLYSISAHKFYAPKGAGALFVRQGVTLQPLQFGGRHERERRAGTENVPGVAAMGAAAEWARRNVDTEAARLTELRDRLEAGILASVPHTIVNAGGAQRTPNATNIRFEGIEGEAMVIALDLKSFAVSSGSACSSGAVEPSHVLMAMGLSVEAAKSCVRFSLGRANSAEQVDALIEAVAEAAAHLRRLSPRYVHV